MKESSRNSEETYWSMDFWFFSTVSLFFLDPSSPLKVNCEIFPRASESLSGRQKQFIYSKQFIWPNKRSDSPIRFCLDNGCPTLLSIALINTVTKNNFGKKGLFWLIHLEGSQSSREVMAWTQVRNLKAGLSWVHWWMLLISLSLWLAQFYFLIQTQDLLPRLSTTHCQLGPPTSVLNREDATQLPYRPSWRRHLLNWGSPFPDDSRLRPWQEVNQHNVGWMVSAGKELHYDFVS